MPPKPPPTDLPIHPFPSAADFEAFLEREHTTAPGIHVKFAKKASGIPSLTHAEAVETALCFGWIDGQGNSFDDQWFLARFTPRRPKSIWSQKNVATIGRLTEAGKMRPAGVAAVDAAKADGRWDRAYAGPATITVADDLNEALKKDSAALAFFEGLGKSDRYAVLWRVETASPQSRAKRIEALVKTLAEGKRPGGPAKSESAPKKTAPAKKAGSKRVSATKQAGKAPAAKVEKAKVQPRRTGLRPRS